MKNKKLKTAIFERFEFLYEAAKCLGIQYSRLSGIISGRVQPSEKDLQHLLSGLDLSLQEIGFESPKYLKIKRKTA